MVYELLDLDSCNLVGTYPNEDVALLAVLETIKSSGQEAASTLSLAASDPTSRLPGQLIAQREHLIHMARQRWQIEQPAAMAV